MRPRSATAAHVCVPARTREEQHAAAAAWAREGHARHELCLYIAEDPEDPQLRASLPEGVAVVGSAETGKNPALRSMLDWLRAKIDKALQAGWTGVRLSQEIVATAPSEQRAEYECRLDQLTRDRPFVAMCIYDWSRLGAESIQESFVTHPNVWVRDMICRNPRYLPPEHYLAADRPDREVSNTIEQLYRDEAESQRHRAWLRSMLANVELERRRVARSLHDDIGQAFVVLALEQHRDAVDDAIETIRVIGRELRPPVLDDLGLVAAVRSLALRQATRAGVKVELDLTADDSKLPAEVVTACYRIIEGALANVVAHALAKTLTVTLRSEPDAIELVVQDDGVGFAPEPRAGMGLIEMEERIDLVGGDLEITSHLGGGTTIRARVPT